jgi:hypothetical protein
MDYHSMYITRRKFPRSVWPVSLCFVSNYDLLCVMLCCMYTLPSPSPLCSWSCWWYPTSKINR